MADKYAVIGNPIAHTKSPLIHATFAKQFETTDNPQDISYEPILAPLGGFKATVHELIKQGYKGANVTVPFKFEAFDIVLPSKRALEAGAVNMLRFLDTEIRGDNTDGLGLVRDIKQNLGVNIANKRILLLGAGGAAEGVLHPLLEESPALLVIANRTLEKANSMQKRAEIINESRTYFLNAQAFDDLAHQQFDIVINATSTGLTDTALPIPSSIFAEGCLAYELMYGRETPFMAQARSASAQVADGLGMLVEQAAEAFYLWRGVRPETTPIIAMLRNN